jgi:hypothetical protein
MVLANRVHVRVIGVWLTPSVGLIDENPRKDLVKGGIRGLSSTDVHAPPWSFNVSNS